MSTSFICVDTHQNPWDWYFKQQFKKKLHVCQFWDLLGSVKLISVGNHYALRVLVTHGFRIPPNWLIDIPQGNPPKRRQVMNEEWSFRGGRREGTGVFNCTLGRPIQREMARIGQNSTGVPGFEPS